MTTETDPECGMELLAKVRVLISASLPALRRCRPSECPGGSWPGAAEHQQVIGHDTEPHPALHPVLAAVPAAPEPMTALERADPSFAPRAPAERRAGDPRARLAGHPRQHDVPDPAVLRSALIRARGEAAVGDGELRGAVEERDVTIQGGRPEGALRLAVLTDGVVGDELRLGLLDLHEPPELSGLGQLALPDDLSVRLEETDHLARIARIVAEHAGSRLSQHLPDQLDQRGQLGRVVPVSRPCQRRFGLAHHRARDPHEALVEDLHLRLALLADPRTHPAAGRATALGDLEDPARHTARALADPSPDPPQGPGEHPDTV